MRREGLRSWRAANSLSRAGISSRLRSSDKAAPFRPATITSSSAADSIPTSSHPPSCRRWRTAASSEAPGSSASIREWWRSYTVSRRVDEPAPATAAGDSLSSRAPHRRRDAGRAGRAYLSRGERREAPRVLHRSSALHAARRARGRARGTDRGVAGALSAPRLGARPAAPDHRHRIGRGLARAPSARRRRSDDARRAARAAPAGQPLLGPLRLPQFLLPQARLWRDRAPAPARRLGLESSAGRRVAPRASPDDPRPLGGRSPLRARGTAGPLRARPHARVVESAALDVSRGLGRVRGPPAGVDRGLSLLRSGELPWSLPSRD